MGMGKIVTSFRHSISKSPLSGPPVFMDAKSPDLPYEGNFKYTRSLFDHPLGLKQEGMLLLAILTGVQGLPIEPLFRKSQEWKDLVHGRSDEVSVVDGEVSPIASSDNVKTKGTPKLLFRRVNNAKQRQGIRVSKTLDIVNKHATLSQTSQSGQAPPVVRADASIDTDDLNEFTDDLQDGDEEAEGSVSWLFEDAQEEEAYKVSLELEHTTAFSTKIVSLNDYTKMVKKSMGKIGYRTQLLEDLALGDDVDMWVKESEFPPIPSTPALPPDKPQEKTKEMNKAAASLILMPAPGDSHGTKATPDYKGAMRATSLVVKRARRLAGLMHTEQQTNDLKDIYDWLQHLGEVANYPLTRGDDTTVTSLALDGQSMCSTPAITTASSAPSTDAAAGHGHKVDWRLPTSPAIALFMAQDDLRQRLAHLFEEQNLMETRKDQLDAAKKLVGKYVGGEGEVKRISGYLHGLHDLNEHYQELNKKARESEAAKAARGKKGKGKDEEMKREKADANELHGKSPKKSRKRGTKKKGKEDDHGNEEIEEDDDSLTNTMARSSSGHGDSESEDDMESESKKSKTAHGTEEMSTSALSQDTQEKKLQSRGAGGDESLEPEESLADSGPGGEGIKKGRKRKKAKRSQSGTPVAKATSTDQGKDGSGAKNQSSSKDATTMVATAKSGDTQTALDFDISSHDATSIPATFSTIRTISHDSSNSSTHDQDEVEIIHHVVDSTPKIPTEEKAIQTNDAVLFNLMESMMEHMPGDAQAFGPEDEGSELRRLRREMKKATMQLRFWRSRNWAEKHARLSPTGTRVHPIIDSSADIDAGFSFYFKSVTGSGGPVPGQPSAPAPAPAPAPAAAAAVPLPPPPSGGVSGAIGRRQAAGGGGEGHTGMLLRMMEAPQGPTSSSSTAATAAQPMNTKLMSNAAAPAHFRPARPTRRPSELQRLSSQGRGLVIFGRSSTLAVPNAESIAPAHLPTHENRVSRLSPRLSGVQSQKA